MSNKSQASKDKKGKKETATKKVLPEKDSPMTFESMTRAEGLKCLELKEDSTLFEIETAVWNATECTLDHDHPGKGNSGAVFAVLKPVVEDIIAERNKSNSKEHSDGTDEVAKTIRRQSSVVEIFYKILTKEVKAMLKKSFPSFSVNGDAAFDALTDLVFTADRAAVARAAGRPFTRDEVEYANQLLELDEDDGPQKTLRRIASQFDSRTHGHLLLFAMHNAHGLSLSSDAVLQTLKLFAIDQMRKTLEDAGLTEPVLVEEVINGAMTSNPEHSDITTNLLHLARSSAKGKKTTTTSKAPKVPAVLPSNKLTEQLTKRVAEMEAKLIEDRRENEEIEKENDKLRAKIKELESTTITTETATVTDHALPPLSNGNGPTSIAPPTPAPSSSAIVDVSELAAEVRQLTLQLQDERKKGAELLEQLRTSSDD